jgi:vitamin B12 transporter
LARRALHTGGASINWQYTKAGSIHANYTYTGSRYEDALNTQQLGGFGLVGIGTRYAVSESATLTANISNLFDKYYETAQGFGSVGRIASAGIEITF